MVLLSISEFLNSHPTIVTIGTTIGTIWLVLFCCAIPFVIMAFDSGAPRNFKEAICGLGSVIVIPFMFGYYAVGYLLTTYLEGMGLKSVTKWIKRHLLGDCSYFLEQKETDLSKYYDVMWNGRQKQNPRRKKNNKHHKRTRKS